MLALLTFSGETDACCLLAVVAVEAPLTPSVGLETVEATVKLVSTLFSLPALSLA